MMHVTVFEALVNRGRYLGLWVADGYAAAGLHTSASAWAAADRQENKRMQGELPRVPTMPHRSLLLRKLVEYQRAARPTMPPAEAPITEKQQIRAARRAATQQYLATVQQAAAKQDIQLLLKHLSAAAAAPGSSGSSLAADPGSNPADPTNLQEHFLLPANGSLLSSAARVAVQQLTAASGRPEHAQAFLELAVERGLLQPEQVHRALHAVLQAYVAAGNHREALAAAARFFDTGGGSSLLAPGTKPTSCTMALLLAAAAETADADLLMGAWRYFGDQYQQQQGSSSSSNSSSSSTKRKCSAGSAADVLPPPNVLHALVYGSVKCDLAAAAAAASASSSSSSSSQYGFAAASSHVLQQQAVSSAVFHADSATVEILRDVHNRLQKYQVQQQSQRQQQQQQKQQKQEPKGQPPLPVALLHPNQASKLLQLTSTAADVDVLLLSQLYQPRGLAVHDIIKVAKQAQTQQRQQQQQQQQQQDGSPAPAAAVAAEGADSLPLMAGQSRPADLALSNNLLNVLPDLKLADVPQFPPRLRSDLARSAVQVYLRHGAVQRAAAVAHAAALANPRDLQQFHLLVRGFAAAGQLLPALAVVDNIRHCFWQSVSPTAQADILRTLTRHGASPPLGAAPAPSRVMSFFRKRCTPHPKTWGALLQGLVMTGDAGPRVWRALHSAMVQPYSFMAMAGFSPEFVDKARSQIVAELFRGILAAPEQGSRLAAVAAAADGAVAAFARVQEDGGCAAAAAVGSSALEVDGRIRRLLLPPAAAAAAGAVYTPSTMHCRQQQQQNAAYRHHNSQQQQQQQQRVPGVSLHEQPVHLRNQVLLVLLVLDVLHSWGVTLHHDAALAAALQVLRFCCDTEDAQASGLLVAVLRSSLNLGIKPGRATLRAMLSCCADLESNSGKTPLGLASGLGFRLQGLGEVDLEQVLAACDEAVQEQQQQQQQMMKHEMGSASSQDLRLLEQDRQLSTKREVQQAAADLLRQWAFNSTFAWVDGVLTNGPTWALKQEAQVQADQVLSVASSREAAAAAVGL